MATEAGKRQQFTSSTPAAIDVSRLVYGRLLNDDQSLSKLLLPQFLDYYTTACIWMRMITINRKNGIPIDEAEFSVLQMIQSTYFCVPEPILLLLKELGNVVTASGQNLFATFPTLPREQIGGRGGFYGALRPPGPGIDDSLHNMYEEIPCLGVLSEAVMHAVSDERPGRYPSVVTYEGRQPNENLIGFRNLGHAYPWAKNVAHIQGIYAFQFSDYPANTAFNFGFLHSISSILAKTKTFRNTQVDFTRLSVNGAASQLVVCRPTGHFNGQRNLQSDIKPMSSLIKYSNSIFDDAILFCSQLMKYSDPKTNHEAWCMISPAEGLFIPPQWVENRNERRNLPINFMQEVSVVSKSAEVHRINVINEMVVNKR